MNRVQVLEAEVEHLRKERRQLIDAIRKVRDMLHDKQTVDGYQLKPSEYWEPESESRFPVLCYDEGTIDDWRIDMFDILYDTPE